MLIVMLSLCRGGRSCSLYASMLYLACSAEVYVNTRLTICWSSPVRRSPVRCCYTAGWRDVTLHGAENWHVMGGDGTWWMWLCVFVVRPLLFIGRLKAWGDVTPSLDMKEMNMRILYWLCTCWHHGDAQDCRWMCWGWCLIPLTLDGDHTAISWL